MFVFGGNTHNDTAHQTTNAKCYSAAFLTYNMRKLVPVELVGTFRKISYYQPKHTGFNPWPGLGLNFG